MHAQPKTEMMPMLQRIAMGPFLSAFFLSPPSGAPPRRTRSARFRVQASYNLGSIFLNKTSGQIWDQKSQTSYNLG